MAWVKKAAPLLILGGALALAPPAEAGGVVIYHYGEDIIDVGGVAEEHQSLVRAELGGTASVGYIHHAFGLFWLDIWTWDGRYCLYNEDRYWEIDAEQAAMFLGRARDDLGKPLSYTFPPGLLVLVGLLAVYAPFKIRSSLRYKELRRLFADERYMNALKLLSDRNEGQPKPEDGSPQDDDGFEESVAYLQGQGIGTTEARRNLTLLIDTIIADRERRAAAEG